MILWRRTRSVVWGSQCDSEADPRIFLPFPSELETGGAAQLQLACLVPLESEYVQESEGPSTMASHNAPSKSYRSAPQPFLTEKDCFPGSWHLLKDSLARSLPLGSQYATSSPRPTHRGRKQRSGAWDATKGCQRYSYLWSELESCLSSFPLNMSDLASLREHRPRKFGTAPSNAK